MKDQFIFVIDYETTGFDPIRNDGITLGVVVLNYQLEMIDQARFRFRPDIHKGVAEDNVATHVHGYTLSEMLFFPERRAGLIELMKFLLKYKHPLNYPRPLFQHSDSHFDYRFMEWAFRKENLQFSFWKMFEVAESFNTVKIARHLNYEGNSLDKWAVRIGETFKHHNELEDAKMCAKVIQYIVRQDFQGNVEEFFECIRTRMNDEEKEKAKGKDTSVQEMPGNEPGSFFNLSSCE